MQKGGFVGQKGTMAERSKMSILNTYGGPEGWGSFPKSRGVSCFFPRFISSCLLPGECGHFCLQMFFSTSAACANCSTASRLFASPKKWVQRAQLFGGCEVGAVKLQPFSIKVFLGFPC